MSAVSALSAGIRSAIVALILLSTSSAAVPASGGGSVNPRAMIKLRSAGQSSPPATLADVAWLEGSWVGKMPEGPVEQVNMAPRFGQMPSFVRSINTSGVIFYEISMFVEVNGSLTIRVKHFTPALAGWEAQDAYIERPLVARDKSHLYFDSITFWRTGPDTYTVYFLNRSGGKEQDTLVIPFRRIALSASRMSRRR